MKKDGAWLPIIDYAKLKGVSISTIRRRIKASRLLFKKEEGKFFIFVDARIIESENTSLQKLRLEKDFLQNKLKKLQEENEDLKMLVQLYEREKRSAKRRSDLTL